jgi:hypothetical protein
LRALYRLMRLLPTLMLGCFSTALAVHVSAADSALPQPVISTDSAWAGVVIIIACGLFLAAAVIGPIIRIEISKDLPPTHSHDEPPGASHHHGKSGLQTHVTPEA